MKEIKITKEIANQRADKFIRKYLNDAPLSFIYKIFRKKDVKINNHWIKENYILNEGETLKIYVTDEQLLEFNKPKQIEKIKVNFSIVYEDENILIANKPKGLLIHGDATEKRATLSNMVLAYLHSKGEFNNNGEGFTPAPCHRLDRNTSGLVIFAKNVQSSQILMELFKIHEQIEKHYLALVKGEILKDGEINAPLLKDSDSGFVKVSSIASGAKRALTKYHPISTNQKYTLVDANLITGRTHQIRAHFSYIGHPILGDQKYGDFNLNKEFDKKFDYHYQFLHAYKIHFKMITGILSYLSGKTFVANMFEKDAKIIKELKLKY